MGKSPESTEARALVTLDEAARILSVSRRTLEREIVYRRFPKPLKIGHASRVVLADVHAYIEWLKQPTARRNLISASVSKQGAVNPSPDILALIDKFRPPGMTEEEMNRYHREVTGEGLL
jgi:predicted DNA-binding transcriptional regulator AlpA